MAKTLTLHFYTDPGHGWAKVSKKDLAHYGLTEDISAFSYMRGDFAYLEEDDDLSKLMRACQASGVTLQLREHCSRERSSKIRSYESYRVTAAAALTEAAIKAKILAQGCSVDFLNNRMIIKVITL